MSLLVCIRISQKNCMSEMEWARKSVAPNEIQEVARGCQGLCKVMMRSWRFTLSVMRYHQRVLSAGMIWYDILKGSPRHLAGEEAVGGKGETESSVRKLLEWPRWQMIVTQTRLVAVKVVRNSWSDRVSWWIACEMLEKERNQRWLQDS